MATTLHAHDTPVPIVINVNMFRLRVLTEAKARAENGRPHLLRRRDRIGGTLSLRNDAIRSREA